MFGNLGTIWAEVGLDTRKLDQGLRTTQVKLAQADRKLNTVGASLTRNSTKFVVAGAAMSGAAVLAGGAAVKMASEFETSMRNVNSIMRVSEEEFVDISDAVLDISKELPQSATTLANGLYDIASSGFAGAEGLEVLEASAKAASAGMTDTATSAKGITAVLNAYGMEADEADRVSDTLFRTVDKGVITFEELSSEIGGVVGTANLANIELEELSGALGYITTQGYNAAEATTALNRLILAIVDPSEELAEVLAKAGYESGELALQQAGLAGVMALVDEAAGGSITKLQQMFVDIRSLRGAGALLGNGIESLTEYMADFEDTTGATNAALEEQSKSLSYQMDLLKSSVKATAIEIGNKLIPQVTAYTEKANAMVDANSDLIASLATMSIKLGLVFGGLTLITGVGSKVATWSKGLAGAFGAIGTAAGLTAGQVGAIAMLIPALAKGMNEATLGMFAAADGTLSWSKALESVVQAITLYPPFYGEIIQNWVDGFRGVTTETREAVEEQEKLNTTMESAQQYIKSYSDSVPVASQEMANLVMAMQNGEISVGAFAIGVEQLREQTKGGREDIEAAANATDDYADKQDLARIKVDAHSKAQEESKYNIDEATESIDGQTKSLDELREEYNKLINDIFGLTNAENALEEANWAIEDAQKAYTEALAEHGEESREVKERENDLDEAYQNKLIVLQELYNEEGISIERKQELRNELVKLLQQTEETSDLSQQKFLEMSETFGLTASEIMVLAGNMGIELDEATKDRLIKVAIEGVEEVLKGAADVKKMIESIPTSVSTSMRVNIIRQEQAMAMGGIVGIPRADYGYVAPQSGREVPVIAHEGEMILNSSQQNNLIDALWGVANGKGEVGGQPININVIAELDGQVIYEKTSQHIYNQSKINQAGAGIR